MTPVFWVSCIPYGTMDGSMGYLDTGALELRRLDTRNHNFCSRLVNNFQLGSGVQTNPARHESNFPRNFFDGENCIDTSKGDEALWCDLLSIYRTNFRALESIHSKLNDDYFVFNSLGSLYPCSR